MTVPACPALKQSDNQKQADINFGVTVIKIIFVLACVCGLLVSESCSLASAEITKTEEIEWTWDVRPANPDPNLPNVLLVGDSISRNYFPEVSKVLTGIANVYLLANSICVGDPRLPEEVLSFSKMEGVRFRVIHFNNGMHGWDYTEPEYEHGFAAYLKAIHTIAPHATYIWTSTTPVRKDLPGGASNARIAARNAIAHRFTKDLLVDDQYALMLKHADLYQDDVHFNPAGSTIEGDEAASLIKAALARTASSR